MSGHSKWATIKHKKGALDAKRGKVFTMHAKIISIAAQSGGDPEMNPTLRSAIDRAKADNVPNANIERAIKKGTGEDKDGASYEEITYEAMGPGGCSFMIDVITDNKNRSNTNVKTILSKNGASQGSAGWKFDKVAYFIVQLGSMDLDDAELSLIDCGAEDFELIEDGKLGVTVPLSEYGNFKNSVSSSGLKVEKDEIIWKAKSHTKIDSKDLAQKILKVMDLLEEDEDVNNVYTDADIPDELLSSLS